MGSFFEIEHVAFLAYKVVIYLKLCLILYCFSFACNKATSYIIIMARNYGE